VQEPAYFTIDWIVGRIAHSGFSTGLCLVIFPARSLFIRRRYARNGNVRNAALRRGPGTSSLGGKRTYSLPTPSLKSLRFSPSTAPASSRCALMRACSGIYAN
jgi:hypothetical protein